MDSFGRLFDCAPERGAPLKMTALEIFLIKSGDGRRTKVPFVSTLGGGHYLSSTALVTAFTLSFLAPKCTKIQVSSDRIGSSNSGVDIMKKLFALSALFVCTVAMNAVAQQSVADAARKAAASRKADPNRKVIDNDVVPAMIASTPDNSAVAAEPAKANASSDKAAAPTSPAEAKDKASADAKENAGKDGKDVKGKDEPKLTPAEEQKKTADSWKKKVDDQKKEITQLQRELDVAEREARLRAAAYAADAGVMLRDQEKFANDSRKSQAEIDTKRQALADAQQKLQEMQEQARKSGVPVGQVE